MQFELLPPREQLSEVIRRIYWGGLTTTSGGNISMRDESGAIWITPSGVDKGALLPRDMSRVHADGQTEGPHQPSSEFPFHRAIYRARPDIGAVVHAHPPGLVSFSVVRQMPDTRIIPQAWEVCGEVGYAPYKLPSSEMLGESIAAQFAEGFDSVIMENHGVVVGGKDLAQAYQRLETLEFCARTQLYGQTLGQCHPLSEDTLKAYQAHRPSLPVIARPALSTREKELRHDIIRFVHRAIQLRLMISTYGTVSTRLDADSFLITPTGLDRAYLQSEDLVWVSRTGDGWGCEPDRPHSRAAQLHGAIYAAHPDVHSIVNTQSPYGAAFCVSHTAMDTSTFPESYVILQEVQKRPFDALMHDLGHIAQAIGPRSPMVLLENDSLLVTGNSLLQAFDRMEVAEFSARSAVETRQLGQMVRIQDHEIEDLRKRFLS
jgi:L-fuculose-phosphate aldolase